MNHLCFSPLFTVICPHPLPLTCVNLLHSSLYRLSIDYGSIHLADWEGGGRTASHNRLFDTHRGNTGPVEGLERLGEAGENFVRGKRRGLHFVAVLP